MIRYKKSNELLERALKVIPLGSQTFSKSHTQYPKNAAPLFLKKGKGGRVWDVDDNEYVDLVNGLLPVVLGYGNKAVDDAIREQLKNGISFSLATELEVQLAERLIDIIPCAEMVRYGKNGSDATSGAIRLARAYTQRDRIAACGYHGWHDWYVGSTVRNLGVPDSVSELTHHFEYNNIDSLEKLFHAHPGEFSAVIMEPMHAIDPDPGFLEAVKKMAHEAGALFIFDEIITGFRYHLGGAQALFNVTPDLATFGKSLGNGMPISAIVGRADVMVLMEDVFYSGTFGGETLSLAAAIAVVDEMKNNKVIDCLWEKGEGLAKAVQQEIKRAELQSVFALTGKPPLMFLQISDHRGVRKEVFRTLLMREMLICGVLMQGSHNISYAHTEEDFKKVLKAYRHAFLVIKSGLNEGNLEGQLRCPVLEPVFRVREVQ